VFTGKCRVVVRAGKCDVGEIITAPGTVWRHTARSRAGRGDRKRCSEGRKLGTCGNSPNPIRQWVFPSTRMNSAK
jgi:hypothetical protein